MNAMTQIRSDESLRGDVSERAHAHTIRLHCPDCDEMELAARCDLAAMRDTAMVGARKAESDSAALMLGEVSKLAMNAVYADVPTSRLLRIRAALTLTMMAARDVERVERDG